jgi:LTXXQ motif family protein
MQVSSRSPRLFRQALLALCFAGSAGLAMAQQPPQAEGGPKPHEGMRGRGMGMMLCAENSEMSLRFIKHFENTVQPKPEQKADFDALKAAVTKADQVFKAACPSEAERADQTPVGRLARIEKTAQATVDAMKLVRPPFDALYAKLDDKQRDRVRWAQHAGHPEGWVNRMREGVHHLFDER